MSPRPMPIPKAMIRFPRVSGDEPQPRKRKHPGLMFSPRERG